LATLWGTNNPSDSNGAVSLKFLYR
jgi:hypothetical protein